MRLTIFLLCVVFGVVPVARGEDASEGGSLAALVDEAARAIEMRARAEGISGAIVVELSRTQGMSRKEVERTFVPRLKLRLRQGKQLDPAAKAPVTCSLALSEENGVLWVVVVLDGKNMPSPSTVALRKSLDRELEIALGRTGIGTAPAHFALERVGQFEPGALDLVVHLQHGQPVLTLLWPDALESFALNDGRAVVDKPIQRTDVPHHSVVPRVLVGSMAADATRVWSTTNGGVSVVWNVEAGTLKSLGGLVPLQQVVMSGEPMFAAWQEASPLLLLPMLSGSRVRIKTPELPPRLRDVAYVELPEPVWIFVDEQGTLLAARVHQQGAVLAERIGDRIAVLDLDGDGAPEIVHSSASAPGEADSLEVRSLEPTLTSTRTLYRHPLSGGGVVSLSRALPPLLPAAEVLVLEDTKNASVVWRLRVSP